MRYVYLILFTLINAYSFSQDQSELGSYLEDGNSTKLTSYFSESIELEILGDKGVFNQQQATIVLNDFFKSNPPSKYFVKHKGGGDNKAIFEIGSLLSNGNEYRTYLLYNEVANKPQIIELRIELEE